VAGYDAASLHGRWTHSHEEDTDTEMVFRPADNPFPPSRGRTSIDLRPDGTFVKRAPGPVDVPEETTGSWALEGGDRLDLGDEVWELTGAEPDRLTFRK
jgi:hypothetical protein